MLNLARKLFSSKKKGANRPDFSKPVPAVILHDDESGSLEKLEGKVMHVDEQGCLDMGEVDHAFGATTEEIHSLPCTVIETLQILGDQTCCAICQSEYNVGDHVRTLPCLHRFHQECIDEWLWVSRSCPCCEITALPQAPAAPAA